MKHTIKQFFLILSVVGSASTIGYTQTKPEKSIPVPDFQNTLMFVNADNTLSNLEKVTVGITRKRGIGLIANPVKTYLQIDGCCSPSVHSGRPTNRFIVKVAPGIDPESIFELFKFELIDNNRKLLIGDVSTAKALSGKTQPVITPIRMNVTKIAEGVYAFSPMEQLPIGEYVFIKDRLSNTMNNKVGFAFAVGQ